MNRERKCLILDSMGNDIIVSSDLELGTGFVPPEYLSPGESENRIRDIQLAAMGKDPKGYRRLKPFELETLVRNNNTCSDWSRFFVMDPFTPSLIHNNFFAGLIRLGKLEHVTLEHHDLHLFAGISGSKIIACDIGDNCVISNCSYIAHYIIGDNCILIDNSEIHATNHSKFGNGIVMEGEDEDTRITIDVMNESGGRTICPFDGLTCGDAYLWAKYRDNGRLMDSFMRMTDAMFDRRRGRYGMIGHDSVLKSNRIIKDVLIGESAYIKGANKLKNLTVNSKDESRTQIGEGVELVNGIIGFGCKVFYGCKAVRFVMRDNSALKYGARLIHSVLGENSTVSCCEILNNLIFPAHEQHHNTSFLIASLVKGQSNMAAGATIGSNHNSRAPDGEIEAGRGFWPGLCTSVKHSSKFASFCLLAKGDYRYELNVTLPFSLVDNDYALDRLVIVPAYWWTNNMYALMRNEAKFNARDDRPDKSIRIEYSPFAPDTAEEIIEACALLEKWTGQAFLASQPPAREAGMGTAEIGADPGQESRAGELGRKILGESGDEPPFEVFAEGIENSGRLCVIHKPARAWRAYREMLLWFSGSCLTGYLAGGPGGMPAPGAIGESLEALGKMEAEDTWVNLGGLICSSSRLEKILGKTSAGEYPTWNEFHGEYASLSAAYPADKARCALKILRFLYRDMPDRDSLLRMIGDLAKLTEKIETEVLASRAKDMDNPFRKATFLSDPEMAAVIGTLEGNGFIRRTSKNMDEMRRELRLLESALRQ